MRRVRAVVMLLSLSSLWRYEDSWLRPFARSLLRFLGFVFWGIAAALAFGGIFVILMYKNYRYLFQEFFLSLPGWLAVLAALILLPTGLLAISISVKGSRYQQGALMYLLLVLLCLEISSGVLAQFYSIRMASELKRTMGYLVYQYNGAPSKGPGSRAVDAIQRKLQCCGVQNYTDWLKATAASWHLPAEKARVPESCCKEKYSHCRGDLGHLEQLFQEGCLKKLEDRLHFIMLYVFWCCTVLSVLELLAGVSNGILMRHQPFHDLRILDSSTF
ncbi:PREDICTED: tetraspanin-3-like [Fulmarus glacialis]|uniref:tetraspanin-3-like n=1 Tax=Fulmarus glacialis TaxID=30455 RepID=UPI00051BF84E|nr:PREDICTED: tetraspanin-3-like [Fulmarus glacialis]